MQITILFFGATADLVGTRSAEFKFPENTTVGEVLEKFKQKNSGLGKHKLLIALNEEYVSHDATVKKGDTLAMFTAVSGG